MPHPSDPVPSAPKPLVIVFVLYEGVTHLDFTGPHQVLSRLPGAKAIVASTHGGRMEADGLVFADLARLSEIPACDVLCVPGGLGCVGAMGDEKLLIELRRLAAGAAYVTSVCTGSLVLAAAGLLRGKRAACHWAWRDYLEPLGAVPDAGRVVRDGNVFTGGGVTAGIDFALVLAAEIGGETLAQSIQLALEYAPAPPFNAGRPETAPPKIVELVTQRMAHMVEARTAAVNGAARTLRGAVEA
jgi:putative intracellular protease/amidase